MTGLDALGALSQADYAQVHHGYAVPQVSMAPPGPRRFSWHRAFLWIPFCLHFQRQKNIEAYHGEIFASFCLLFLWVYILFNLDTQIPLFALLFQHAFIEWLQDHISDRLACTILEPLIELKLHMILMSSSFFSLFHFSDILLIPSLMRKQLHISCTRKYPPGVSILSQPRHQLPHRSRLSIHKSYCVEDLLLTTSFFPHSCDFQSHHTLALRFFLHSSWSVFKGRFRNGIKFIALANPKLVFFPFFACCTSFIRV